MTKRSQFVTKTGVIATTVGSAVGLGNIWRFPYEAGVHGGGAFLLIYIICVFLIGIPVMLSEFVMGREAHLNPKGTWKRFAAGTPFMVAPYLGIIAGLMILSFYSVVAGWIMEYVYQSVVALFQTESAADYADRFHAFVAHPWRPLMWTLIFLALNFLVLRRGVEKGIEKMSNLLMPLLFLILLAFCVNSLFLPGAATGLDFLFNPDFTKVNSQMVIGAMGQAFFSLSLGLCCMLTYASYFSDDTPLVRSAATIAGLDSIVAIMAGLLIFPAVFTYGLSPEAGPKLVFETLPAIFAQMPGGHLWSVAFFVLLFFASITSTISMSEISISFFVEELRLTRHKGTSLCIGIAVVFGSLCALSFGPLADVTICGKTIFNLFDYLSSNILLPLGGILFSLFVGWFLDRRIISKQLAVGKTLRMAITLCIRYIAPTAILVIFIYGLM